MNQEDEILISRYRELISQLPDDNAIHADFVKYLQDRHNVAVKDAVQIMLRIRDLELKAQKGTGFDSTPRLACFLMAGGLSVADAIMGGILVLKGGILVYRIGRKRGKFSGKHDKTVDEIEYYLDFLKDLFESIFGIH